MENRTWRQSRCIPGQFRAVNNDGEKRIEGYFADFHSVYKIFPGATESIDPHAFDETLNDDIRMLIDHDTRLVLGRNKAGTAEFKADSIGLWASAKVNEKDQDALNLYARVERGDVNQGSFGFDILDEETEFREDGSIHWTIKKVKLYEVSVVTFPAYEATSVVARKQEYEQIRKRQLEAWLEKMKARLKRC